MLTLIPTPADVIAAERHEVLVRMPVAVAVNRLGGWAIVGWRGAAPIELAEQVRLVIDDPVGAVRMTTVTVPVLADGALADLLGDSADG